jgi:DNA-binding transcriptional LysR family regulator
VELRHLEYFLAVVEEGSFTRAAARLYMVQSSLSAALLNLERELGTELFIRGRRSDLTDAGQALVEPARIALVSVEHAKEAVAEVNGLLRGTVRIAVLAVPPALDLIDTIARFSRAASRRARPADTDRRQIDGRPGCRWGGRLRHQAREWAYKQGAAVLRREANGTSV